MMEVLSPQPGEKEFPDIMEFIPDDPEEETTVASE